MKISLLISTYNNPRALRAALDGVKHQTRLPDEVLIADDGSSDETWELIKSYQAQLSVPIRHLWQPNEGFRASMIRNKAIAEASGDYIVQIDGDILMHPRFIADHEAAARRGFFACGSRVIVERELTEKIFNEGTPLIIHFSAEGIRNRKNAVHAPLLGKIYNLLPGAKLKYRGCNMGFWRDDLLKVDGYDETYVGWGCEDHDLIARLMNAGVQPLQLRHRAICYHLWHPTNRRDDGSFERNNKLLDQTRAEHRVEAKDGLKKYLYGAAKNAKG